MVLKKPDEIIHLTSDFGVKKDVSNNVEYVQLVNNPAQTAYQRTLADRPTEAGDGFVFALDQQLDLRKQEIDYTGNGFTMEMWLYLPSDLPATFAVWDQLIDNANYTRLSQGTTGNRLSFFGRDYTNGNTEDIGMEINNTELPLEEWHHVAFMVDTSIGAIAEEIAFVDGKQVWRTVTGAAPTIKINAAPRFGIASLNWGNFRIDDFKLTLKPKYPYKTVVGSQMFTPPERSSA